MQSTSGEEPVGGTDDSPSELVETLKTEVLKSIARALETRAEHPICVLDFHERGVRFYEEVTKFEIELIKRALAHTKGNQRAAARLLGLNPATLNSKMRIYKLGRPGPGEINCLQNPER